MQGMTPLALSLLASVLRVSIFRLTAAPLGRNQLTPVCPRATAQAQWATTIRPANHRRGRLARFHGTLKTGWKTTGIPRWLLGRAAQQMVRSRGRTAHG